MKKVFISYSSKEYDIAAKLRKAFTDRGLLVWMAPESIPAGSNYAVEIPKAIQSCDIVVLLLSENSQNSIWVQREIDTAVNNNKLLFPVKTDNYQLIPPFDFYLTDIQVSQETEEPEIVANKLCKTLGLDVEETDIQTITKKKFSLKSPKGIALMASAAVLTALITVLVPVFLKPSAMEYTIVDSVGMFEFTGEYKGELKKGLPDGIGEFTGINSDNTQFTYNGEFRNGEIDGKGVGYYEDEASTVTYDGEWDDNLPNGSGTRTDFYKEGDIEEIKYVGLFENYFLTGNGTRTSKYKGNLESSTAEGEFKNDKLNGYGMSHIIGETGETIYSGIFTDDVLNGLGTLKTIFANGNTTYLEGKFINGDADGTSTLITYYNEGSPISESIYVGNIYNGVSMNTGRSEIYYKNGDTHIYYGEFKDDVANGEGKLIITYAEGDIEKQIKEGTFKDDEFIGGKGSMTSVYRSGEIESRYLEGNLNKEGKLNGHGIYKITLREGELQEVCTEGEYINNEEKGFVTERFIYRNGDIKEIIYEGTVVDGAYDGFGVLTYNFVDGTSVSNIGKYKNHMLNGRGSMVLRFKDEYVKAEIFDGNFIDDERNGYSTYITVYKNGNEPKVESGEWIDNEFIR